MIKCLKCSPRRKKESGWREGPQADLSLRLLPAQLSTSHPAGRRERWWGGSNLVTRPKPWSQSLLTRVRPVAALIPAAHRSGRLLTARLSLMYEAAWRVGAVSSGFRLTRREPGCLNRQVAHRVVTTSGRFRSNRKSQTWARRVCLGRACFPR